MTQSFWGLTSTVLPCCIYLQSWTFVFFSKRMYTVRKLNIFSNILIFRLINFCVIWKRKTINLIILESWTFDAFLLLFILIKRKDWVPFQKLPTLISRKIYEAENSLISTQRSGSSVTTHCFSLIRRVWCSLGQPPLLQQVHFLSWKKTCFGGWRYFRCLSMTSGKSSTFDKFGNHVWQHSQLLEARMHLLFCSLTFLVGTFNVDGIVSGFCNCFHELIQ